MSLAWTVAWSVALYLFTGSRVKVRASIAVPFADRPLGLYIGVTVNNAGRTPVTVTGWGLKAAGKQILLTEPESWQRQVPHRLDGR